MTTFKTNVSGFTDLCVGGNIECDLSMHEIDSILTNGLKIPHLTFKFYENGELVRYNSNNWLSEIYRNCSIYFYKLYRPEYWYDF